ncbi:helix-turn-helix domain-containing protein [Paenibacillus xylanilyticus]|uniref:Helix-turn-helix domain-containing protein n=1 Tax=Paenibacillus xylanilyticus TaxID=248903 RepID=A0A7Y6BXD5_9BACL|nr:helix-turn-helix domain-containing protein [Paenibacillus xylanilyticus]NUU76737.1 helix-turn-helix domain-containing protein [Paenibacillus xylanilyticus]
MNTLLVDDDYFVVMALEKKLDWNALGINTIYTAYNIAQAKDILERHSVQILICDIEMPQGSGLELLAWVREESFNIQTIFLTNYADFNYAQKAIELQSFDYFLKPIEFDKLTLIVQKAIAKAREQQFIEKAIQEGELWQKNRSKLVEDSWRRLIFGKAFPSGRADVSSFLTEQHLPYQAADQFLPILIHLFPHERSLGMTDKNLFDYACLNVMVEQFQHVWFSIEAVTEIKSYNWMVILKWNQKPDIDLLEAMCSSFIPQANEFLKSDACCSLGVSRPLEQIRYTIDELLRMNEERIKNRNQTFLLAHYNGQELHYLPPDLGMLEQLLQENRYTDFLDQTADYMQHLVRNGGSGTAALRLLRLDLVQLVYAHLKSKEIEAHKLYMGKTNDQLFMQSLNSIEDMHAYIAYLVNTAADYLNFTEQPKSVVHEITEYIRSHCGEDLTRNSLGEIVFLNPDYLARLFKKEMGISLGHYVIRTRLAAARRLLETSAQSVHAIACSVGYTNYSHFAKLFKQEVGCSPNEYRKNAKISRV